MTTLRTLEQAWLESPEGTIFVVAAKPRWPHYDPDDCPKVIRAWLETHYPHVTIEKLSGTECDYASKDDPSQSPSSEFVSGPMFRLDLTLEEAKNFQDAWDKPPLHTPEAPSDFDFIICGREEDAAASGMLLGELFVPVADRETQPLEQESGSCRAR
jgi:hypothetical protein